MYHKCCSLAAVGAVAIAMSAVSAQAAPLGGVAQARNATAGDVVQDAAWVRHCWRHRGNLHCRRVWRDDGYYYGPSFRFFGGGGRHNHYHRHHRH